jgi:hypothetical protein
MLTKTSLCSCPLLAALFIVLPSPLRATTLTWTQVLDHNAGSDIRSLRGLALSNDEQSLYAGFIQGSDTAGFRDYQLSPFSLIATHDVNAVDSTTKRQAEAVTTDDRGIVYGASIKDSTSGVNARITLLNANFSTTKHFSLADITGPPNNSTGETIGGLSIRKSGSDYQLYVSRHLSNTAYIERYIVGGTDVTSATLTLDATFGSGGQFNLQPFVASADYLRGLEVAADGTMFVASRENDTVYRISSALDSVTSTTVVEAMDVALFGPNLYVTQYNGANSAIVELNQATLTPTGSVFTATGTFPHTEASTGYSGIDIDSSGRIYLADQIYNASNADRILVSSPIPEPSTGALSALATLLFFAWRRRRGASLGIVASG